MDREIFVHVDLDGTPQLVGRLWARVRTNREAATFEYDRSWLTHAQRFSLEPALTLGPGPFHTAAGRPLFGAIGDSAPDRWGRALMRRMARRRAEREGGTPRALREVDYLLLVDDETRAGALRFGLAAGGPFLRERADERIPPILALPQLLAATERVLADAESDEDLALLLAPGSSLGGARPKASVRDRDQHLAIAKFPRRDDEYRVELWEAVATDLARRGGLTVPEARIEDVAGQPVFLSRRFDRVGAGRVPVLSALSLLGARDHDTRSYLEIADALRQHGAATSADLSELWRRIVFNVLISNTDDHLRNHAVLYGGGGGWRLSPAYDLNPVPADIKPRVLTTAINASDTTASLGLALEVAEYFELAPPAARGEALAVARSVAQWRSVAARYGLRPGEIDRMASAFEHQDLRTALRG